MFALKRFFLVVLLVFPPGAIWLVFLLRYGDSVNTAEAGYYWLLCPLCLYLLFFLSFFQPRKEPSAPRLWKQVFRIAYLFFMALSLLDALAAYGNRYLYQRSIDGDKRYTLFIHNWLEKRRFKIPPASGDTAPGPFIPYSKGAILDSVAAVDRWGFRRDIPDRYAETPPEKTINVLCLGGSVLFGMTSDSDDLAPPDWLQLALQEEIANLPIRVYNAAFPGVDARSLVVAQQTAYWQIHPHILFYYEAINWLAPGQKSFLQNRNSLLMTWARNREVRRNSARAVENYTPSEYQSALEAFIDSCRENDPDAIPVLMTYSLPFTENDSVSELAYWDRMQNGQGCAYAAAVLVRKHNEALLAAAQNKGAPFIDTRPFLNDKPDLFIDSCHLTQEGSQILAWLMADFVIDLVDP